MHRPTAQKTYTGHPRARVLKAIKSENKFRCHRARRIDAISRWRLAPAKALSPQNRSQASGRRHRKRSVGFRSLVSSVHRDSWRGSALHTHTLYTPTAIIPHQLLHIYNAHPCSINHTSFDKLAIIGHLDRLRNGHFERLRTLRAWIRANLKRVVQRGSLQHGRTVEDFEMSRVSFSCLAYIYMDHGI